MEAAGRPTYRVVCLSDAGQLKEKWGWPDECAAFRVGAVLARDWLRRLEHKAQPCAAAPLRCQSAGAQT